MMRFDKLEISFDYEGIHYTLKVPSDNDVMPWDIARVFEEVLRKAPVNVNMVIQELISTFDYAPEEEQLKSETL